MLQALRYDVLDGVRNPPSSRHSVSEGHPRTVAQIELADQIELDHAWLSEHHLVGRFAHMAMRLVGQQVNE